MKPDPKTRQAQRENHARSQIRPSTECQNPGWRGLPHMPSQQPGPETHLPDRCGAQLLRGAVTPSKGDSRLSSFLVLGVASGNGDGTGYPATFPNLFFHRNLPPFWCGVNFVTSQLTAFAYVLEFFFQLIILDLSVVQSSYLQIMRTLLCRFQHIFLVSFPV